MKGILSRHTVPCSAAFDTRGTDAYGDSYSDTSFDTHTKGWKIRYILSLIPQSKGDVGIHVKRHRRGRQLFGSDTTSYKYYSWLYSTLLSFLALLISTLGPQVKVEFWGAYKNNKVKLKAEDWQQETTNYKLSFDITHDFDFLIFVLFCFVCRFDAGTSVTVIKMAIPFLVC